MTMRLLDVPVGAEFEFIDKRSRLCRFRWRVTGSARQGIRNRYVPAVTFDDPTHPRCREEAWDGMSIVTIVAREHDGGKESA
jgi:hypothetical protein